MFPANCAKKSVCVAEEILANNWLQLTIWTDELTKAAELLAEAKKKLDEKDEQVQRLQTEVDDIKTAVAISEATKEDYVLEIRRKYDEEVKSMQRIMKGNIQWFFFHFYM